jgi:hypothetical protein
VSGAYLWRANFLGGVAAEGQERARDLRAPCARAERVTTTGRSLILGLGRVRLFAFVSRNGIAAGKPTAEVDIGAPSGTKWPKSLARGSAADRTPLGLIRLYGIAHAANIGRDRLKGKGPLAASFGKLEIRPVRPGARRGQKSPARMPPTTSRFSLSIVPGRLGGRPGILR